MNFVAFRLLRTCMECKRLVVSGRTPCKHRLELHQIGA